MVDDKKSFHINWPKGAKITMDEKSLEEIRKTLEVQFKLTIYNQPGFKFFHSMGNTNFFQRFKTNDGIDFGTCHVYWDKDADDEIYVIDKNKNLKEYIKCGWRHRWFAPGETPEVVAPFGKSIISEEGMQKIYKVHAERIADIALRQNKNRMEELQHQQQKTKHEDNEEEDEKILLN